MPKICLLLSLLALASSSLLAKPIFYFTARSTSGGLYTIDEAAKTVNKINQAPSQDFMSVSKYGNDQLLVSSYGSRELYIFNQDGSAADIFSLQKNPLGAIEQADQSGNIYYADYFGSAVRSYNISTGQEAQVHDVSTSRSYGVEMRSSGELYLVHGDIRHAATNTPIYSGVGSPYWVSMDENDNFFASPDRSSINKIDANNNIVSNWWSDSSIDLFNFNYDPVSGLYYGIGTSNGQHHVYQFTKDGQASIYLENISGFNSSSNFQDLVVLNDAANVIAEPSTVCMLLMAAFLAIFNTRGFSNKS